MHVTCFFLTLLKINDPKNNISDSPIFPWKKKHEQLLQIKRQYLTNDGQHWEWAMCKYCRYKSITGKGKISRCRMKIFLIFIAAVFAEETSGDGSGDGNYEDCQEGEDCTVPIGAIVE